MSNSEEEAFLTLRQSRFGNSFGPSTTTNVCVSRPTSHFAHQYIMFAGRRGLACEQALCLGKNSKEREGEAGERACRQTFEAAIPPSCT